MLNFWGFGAQNMQKGGEAVTKMVGLLGAIFIATGLMEVGNVMETTFVNPLLTEVVALSPSPPLIDERGLQRKASFSVNLILIEAVALRCSPSLIVD
jgi:hypothetical protein